MSETAAPGIPNDGTRERFALDAFVTIAVVATLSWLVLLGWLLLTALRAVGI